VLKAEVKSESVEELRCAHGMCAPLKPLTWKEIFRTLLKDHIWIQLLKINPLKWKLTIAQWEFEDRLSDILAEEIRKEIDAEIVEMLSRLSHVETTTDPAVLKKLGEMVGYHE
jgi:hypothetical protein